MRCVAACFIAITSITSVALAHDLLIRHGKVIDGTGNSWFYADVAIDKDRIVAIGDLSEETATKEVDATGLIVAPGFIDVHTHVDDDILQHPLAENFVRDGVTTIVSGNCGSSVLDVGAFITKLRAAGSAVNNATLYGHNTILRKLKGPISRDLSPAELEKGKQMLDQAMRDGAVGFSTGLIYTPGEWSDTGEVIELAKVAGHYGGIYTTHMRSESTEIERAINEALTIGKESHCRVEISHMKLPTDVAIKFGRGTTLKAGSERTLAMVHAARGAGLEVWMDQYPYTASSTTLSTLLPDDVLDAGPDEAKKRLADPATHEKVLDEMRKLHEVSRQRTDMAWAVVVSTPFGNGKYNGKSMKQVAQMLKYDTLNPKPASADDVEVSMREQYEAAITIYLNGGGSGVFHSCDEIEVCNIMRDPLVGVCSDSGIRVFGEGVPHPRGYGSNTRVLGKYVRQQHVITLEEAIRKMTSMPATAFRFEGRGVIRNGNFADLTIFDADKVEDMATYEKPHQYPVGIKCVIVSGQVVFDGEKMTGAKPGAVLLGPGYSSKS